MLRIDPTAEVSVYYCRARIYWHRGRFDLSYYELEKARAIEPNHPIIKFFHAIVTFLSGHPPEAIEELRSLLAVCSCKAFPAYLAICLSAQGEFEAAECELTEECERIAEVDPDVSYWVATAKLMAGRIDEALKWLGRSIALGNHNRALLKPIRSGCAARRRALRRAPLTNDLTAFLDPRTFRKPNAILQKSFWSKS
jgi:tetratricopeptide (TPR) repeat protein